jgi:predicted phage-related endonuclease
MPVSWISNDGVPYDEWLFRRNNSIGASEMGAVVLGNKFTSNLEIFYNKVAGPKTVNENLRMLIGTETEDLSSKLWKHYDGTNQNSIVTNLRNNTPVKDCAHVNVTAFNSKWPFISATPDRKILPVLEYEGMGFGCLEIKNSQQMVLDSYIGGIPTDNLFQVVTQMMVTEWKYSNLFYFLDNRSVTNHFIKLNDVKSAVNAIINTATPFWDSIIAARPLYNQMCDAKRKYNMKLAAELEVEIALLEPPAQTTEGYHSYLNDRYLEKMQGVGIIPGNDHLLSLARKDKQLEAKTLKLEKERLTIHIELKNAIKEANALDFGKYGMVTWYANKNGNRAFKNKIK